jgi:hypothetical protein
MSRAIPWSSLVLQADPEHQRKKRFVREYEFSAPGGAPARGNDKTHDEGKRIFEGDYQTRGPYADE